MSSATPDFHGILPYLVSPIDDSTGAVREHVLHALIEHLIASGVHGVSPLGSTGEIVYLTAAQRVAIARDGRGGRRAGAGRPRYLRLFDNRCAAPGRSAVEARCRWPDPDPSDAVSCLAGGYRALLSHHRGGSLGADLTPEIIDALSAAPNIRVATLGVVGRGPTLWPLTISGTKGTIVITDRG